MNLLLPVEPAPVFFRSFIEVLFTRGLAGALTRRCKERLALRGLELDRPLDREYPAERLEGWLDVLASELSPSMSREAAHEHFGRTFIGGWRQTFIGRSLIPVVKLLPARLALRRLQQNFRATDNFTRVTLVDEGPTSMRLRFEDVNGVPYFYEGLLDEGAGLSSARHPRAQLLEQQGTGAVFRCAWER